LNIGAATFIPAANDPDNLRKSNFFSGAVAFTQRPTEGFGYAISYQALVTNRSGINGPLGVGFQPFGGAEQSDFDGRIQTFNAHFDVRAGRANLITGGYEFESENFKNPSLQPNPADNSNVDVTQRSHDLFRIITIAERSPQFREHFAPSSFAYNNAIHTRSPSPPG
jgi:hypothetical protein